jgi:hypothetical protein
MAEVKILSGLNFNGNPAKQFLIEPLTEDPATGVSWVSRMYYNTTTKKYRFFNGTAWKDVSETDITFDDKTMVKDATTGKYAAYAVLTQDALPSPCDKPHSLFLVEGKLYFYDDSNYIEILNKCPFPVGGIYIRMDNTNPSTLWADTSWSLLTGGRCLWNTSTGGGELLDGMLPALPTMSLSTDGAHTHTVDSDYDFSNPYCQKNNYYGLPTNTTVTTSTAGKHTHTITFGASTVYGASTDNTTVRPTSIAVCMWQRTA